MRDKLFGKYRAKVDAFFAWTLIGLASIGAYDIYKFFDNLGWAGIAKFFKVILMVFVGLIILFGFVKQLYKVYSAKLTKTSNGKFVESHTDGLRPKNHDHMSDSDMIEWLDKNKNGLTFYDLVDIAKNWSYSNTVKGKILNMQKFWTRNPDRDKYLTRGELLSPTLEIEN